jgi:NADH dehydrogenase
LHVVATADRIVVVFGGTGFLGRRIVRHLRQRAFPVRVASRHPHRSRELFGADDGALRSIEADIHDERSIAQALIDAYGVVNAVSLYVERRRETFQSVHVEAARRVAAKAQHAGVERLVHVSGIGSDPASSSLYVRKRGEGELAVRSQFASAVLVRPAVMFGPDDAFLTTILALLRRLPIYPMFGRGLTKLQPVYVEDVGQAVAAIMQGARTEPTFEFGGPQVYSYEELLRAVAREAGLKPILMPVPFAAWRVLTMISDMLPNPPLTRNQVELMQLDNVQSPVLPGLDELGVARHSVEDIVRSMPTRS